MAAVVVQAAHVAALFAAQHPLADPTGWAERTLVAHCASPGALAQLIVDAGGAPYRAGSSLEASWFVEEDLLWSPTALATAEPTIGASAVLDMVSALPLWVPPPSPAEPGRPSRRWWCDLSAATRRDGLSAAELWAAAAEHGDPSDLVVRGRVAHRLVRGEEADELS